MDAGLIHNPLAATGILTYLGMGLMVLVGACLQGIGGIGFAMFSAPVAALLFPQLVPGPLLALGCPLALMAALRERRATHWPAAGMALTGRVVGTALAAACVAWLPVRALSLLFALLILSGVGLSLIGWRVAPSRANITLAGLASGLMGTLTSAGAPPFAIAMQNLPPPVLRATLGWVFFVGSAVSLLTLAVMGHMSLAQLGLSIMLAPWMLAGFGLSGPLNRRLGGHSIRPFLLGFAALGAMGVLLRLWLTA
ncbi:sulfite exporter TauE/SafE family protein [Ideonella benzenivorans]|uniref:sulfite exporter TauE/SafE family protein n=1 Tax=Ideonella benzenivorans TaxID=2831643 RepID=UPI001CECC928|nr:sulfite exporter TauE/SafE family protein [Ideonella benzenivorans]